jgi:hypothetical protein
VALLALSLEKQFDNRQAKSPNLSPVATPAGNHRALRLGGGGVRKTRTLRLVVEPPGAAFFGEDGYLATAQSNHAAQNLGPRGRTLSAGNRLLAIDSLQTARARPNAQAQKKWID